MTDHPVHSRLQHPLDDDSGIVSHRLSDDRKGERGYLGQFFGPSGHMVYYVALACILFSVAGMVVCVLAGVGKDFEQYAGHLLILGVGLLGGGALK